MTTFDFNLGDTPVVIHAPAVGEFDSEAADAMFAAFEADPRRVVGLDVETTAHDKLGPMHRDFRVRTVQLATEAEAWVLRLDDDEQRVMAEAVLADDTFRFCSHTRYDVLAVWREFGIDISGRWADTRLLARIANPLSLDRHDKAGGNRAVDLKTLTTERLGPELAQMDKALDELFQAMWKASGQKGRPSKQRLAEFGFNNVDLADETFVTYAGLDAIACRALYPLLVSESQTTAELLGMELWLAGNVARLQMRGMRVDRERLQREADEAAAACSVPEAELVAMVGLTPRQSEKLAAWFTGQGIDFEAEGHELSPTGRPKLDADNIEKMLEYDGLTDDARKVVELLLAYKERENALAKTKEMVEHVEASFDGRLHATVDSLGAITARMTASAPNIQNYAKSDPRMRACLLPDEGHVLIGADFDQVELRVMAALTQEESFLETIHSGGDLHQLTADKIGVDRQVGKRINFLQAYGGGARPLAKAAGISLEEAQAATRAYREAYPSIAAYSAKLQESPEVRTMTYRRIPATTGHDGDFATFRFLNYMIQSSSRDLLVLAWHRLAEAGYGDAVWVPIHDEMILQVREEDVENAMAVLQDAMTMDCLGVPIGATAVALIDEDGVSRWMTCDRAEKVRAAQTVSAAA